MLVILNVPELVIGPPDKPVPVATLINVPGALLVTHAVVATFVLLSLLARVGGVNSVPKFVA